MKNILVVGATNIDVIAKSYNKIKLYDKNPGKTTFSYGGVARNICENIARLDVGLTFATIIGSDEIGKGAIKYLNDLNVEVIYKQSSLPTSTFISVLDKDADNYISISSMDIYDELDKQFLENIDYARYDLIISDANSTRVAKALASKNTKLFIDATSDAKAKNIKEIINDINYLKCTKTEMMEIFDTTDILNVVDKYNHLTLIITDKSNPVIYNVGKEIFTKEVETKEVVNAIGAGDSFSAGIVYGLHHNYSLEKCVDIAIKVAGHSVTQESTVSKNLNRELIGE